VKVLTGTAFATTTASPEQCFSLLLAVDRYPGWHGDVVTRAEVVERDAQGQPIKARAKLHVERGPLTKDFDLLMAVNADPFDMIKLSRIPHEPTDPERFDVVWRMRAGQSTHIRLDLAANLSVPRLVPLGGVGDALAQRMVNAAARALQS
jgi:polyketide cyclase/dehydrase/lipid transport protein